MKYLKLITILSLLILSTSIYCIADNKNTTLNDNELKSMFPDDNFRNVILNNFNNEDITIHKLELLDGELYASGEDIKDLTGISYLHNINRIILYNNSIKTLPEEITNLNNLQYINISNNYLTDNTIIQKLTDNNISVNYNLNFIDNTNNQYNLISREEELSIKRGEVLDLTDLLYKDIDEYIYKWEISQNIDENIQFNITSNNDNVIIKNNRYIQGINTGKSKVNINILNKNSKNSSLILNIEIN